jgi:hypothetical protein
MKIGKFRENHGNMETTGNDARKSVIQESGVPIFSEIKEASWNDKKSIPF